MKGFLLYNRKKSLALCIILIISLSTINVAPLCAAPLVRIKDIADIEGVRGNQLVGMGLVVGLSGTGDKSPLAQRMIQNLVKKFGLNVTAADIKSKNVAVVTVTANLPPFVRPGQRIDVEVSSIGDAKSLRGGFLLQTPLKAANGKIYAVAQGPVIVGGFSVTGQAGGMQKNITTVGRIPGGAIVERDVPTEYIYNGRVRLILRTPDFTTANRIARTINKEFGPIANAVDAATVEVRIPPRYMSNPVTLLSKLEVLEVKPDVPAKVVVNERTGTIVMGENVRISTVAVAHGNLTVRVTETPQVSQPQPFSQGQTVVTPRTTVAAKEEKARIVEFKESATVGDVVKALNAVGATPQDIISILQAIKEAGALHAELVTM